MANDYRGTIAIARADDMIEDPIYKIHAKFITGPLKDNEAFVSYPGDRLPKGDILVRLDTPIGDTRSIGLQKYDLVAFFLTENIPTRFEDCENSQALLWGIWYEDMPKKGKVPGIYEIEKFYLPGRMRRNLHFGLESPGTSYVIPFELGFSGFQNPQISQHESGRMRGLNSSLRRYITRLGRQEYQNDWKIPRVLTVDVGVNIKAKITPLLEDIAQQEEMHCILMEAAR